jgi:hypothetical protein
MQVSFMGAHRIVFLGLAPIKECPSSEIFVLTAQDEARSMINGPHAL